MSTADVDPELALALARLVPLDDHAAADWDDVLARLGRDGSATTSRVWRVRSRKRTLVALAAALALAVASIGTAAYLVLGRSDPSRQAELTLVAEGSGRLSDFQRIVAVDSSGRLRTIWQCPGERFCGQVVSIAWSRSGRRLAIALDQLGGQSPYVGLHLIDLDRRSDTRVPRLPASATLPEVARANRQTFGCFAPYGLAWSSNGRRLAYVCPASTGISERGRIFTIGADGTGRTQLRTGFGEDVVGFPSWSPDGWIAFGARRDGHLAVYVARPNGTGIHLVVSYATAPAWSPDGKVIAYSSTEHGCRGVRLVTPDGDDVTPGSAGCNVLGPEGSPAWSQDGRQVAIGARDGVYVVARTGGRARRVTTQTGLGVYGAARPAWSPGTRTPTPAHVSTCGEGDCY